MWPVDVLASFHTWLHERRVYRGIAECGAAALLLWVGVNAIPHPTPAPLWSADELPALPSASDNGWTALGEVPFEAHTPDALTVLFDLEPGLDGADFWRRARTERAQLEAWLAAHRESLARVELARAQPEFVDDCRSLESCTTLDWSRSHELALGRVVELALDGRRRDAEALLTDLLRMDQAQLDSAPTILSVLVSLANARRAMVLAGHLVALDPTGTSTRLRRRVANFDARSYDLELLVQVRYRVWAKAIHDRQTIGPHDLGQTSFLTFDPGTTRTELDRRMAHAHARAAVGDLEGACGAGQDRLQDRPLWQVHNPVGSMLLDRLDVSELCQGIEERAQALDATRATTLEQFEARARAKRGPSSCAHRLPSTR